METMTAAWTDARFDERFAHIDTRFDRLESVVAVKSETRELQNEIARLTTEVESLRDEMRGEFRTLREETAALREEMTKEFRALRGEMSGDRRALIVALIAAIAAILVKGG